MVYYPISGHRWPVAANPHPCDQAREEFDQVTEATYTGDKPVASPDISGKTGADVDADVEARGHMQQRKAPGKVTHDAITHAHRDLS